MGSDGRGAVLFDLDGTLVDSNYQHALAWYRAFRSGGILLPLWRIHRCIGMGGDQMVPALIGEARDREIGDDLRAAEKAQFEEMLSEIAPLEGAHELLVDLHARGYELVLASSSPEEYLDRYLDLLDARTLVDAATTAKDVEATKPAPDIIEVAKAKARRQALVMVGDSPWDIESAGRAGLSCVCLLTGGYSERELLEAGAEAVFDSLLELRACVGTCFLGNAPRTKGHAVNAPEISEEELALMVAIEKGYEPRVSDPLSRALKARGLVECAAGSWALTQAGTSYLSTKGGRLL
jgi:HAD superfamily hydrolase (TIGR01509 family)